MDQNGSYVSYHIRGDDDKQQQLGLPPGFRFHPTDEELVTHYLSKKVADRGFSTKVIAEVDITKCEPWDLPWRATRVGEKEGYFFCVRDRKYPTGLRTNRATDTGYWKATGKDREIHRGMSLVGMKKTLVFFRGRAPKGEKTDWVMHEYRLHGNCSLYNLPKAAKNEWVICRVCQKRPAATAGCGDGGGGRRMPLDSAPSYGGRLMMGTTALLPPLSGSTFGSAGSTTVRTSPAAAAAAHVTCFSNVVKRHDKQMDIMDCSFNHYCPVFPTASNPSSDVSSSLLLRLLQSLGHVAEGCKAEGEVGGSRSPETGLTNDTNAEISPVPSSHEVGRRQWFGGQVPTAPSGDTALHDSSGTTRIWWRDL